MYDKGAIQRFNLAEGLNEIKPSKRGEIVRRQALECGRDSDRKGCNKINKALCEGNAVSDPTHWAPNHIVRVLPDESEPHIFALTLKQEQADFGTASVEGSLTIDKHGGKNNATKEGCWEMIEETIRKLDGEAKAHKNNTCPMYPNIRSRWSTSWSNTPSQESQIYGKECKQESNTKQVLGGQSLEPQDFA